MLKLRWSIFCVLFFPAVLFSCYISSFTDFLFLVKFENGLTSFQPYPFFSIYLPKVGCVVREGLCSAWESSLCQCGSLAACRARGGQTLPSPVLETSGPGQDHELLLGPLPPVLLNHQLPHPCFRRLWKRKGSTILPKRNGSFCSISFSIL